MRRAVLGILMICTLVIAASTGSAQMRSEKKGTRWEGTIICSDRVGKGPLDVSLYEDSTFALYWRMECLGFTVVSSPVQGTYSLKGHDFNAVAKGFVRTHHGPSSYYEVKLTGMLSDSRGEGEYEMTFFEENPTGRGWPRGDEGTWEVERVK